MARSQRSSFAKPPAARSADPLARLENVRPVFFFTPDLEREINKLESVISCRVLSTGAQIEEIHVFALPQAEPKKIVRNIESLLLVRFGLRIDHRKVSVVQLGQPDIPSPEIARPSIRKIEKRTGPDGESVCVEICVDGAVISGLGRAQEGETDLHASSRALINAIERLLDERGVLSLHGISIVSICNWQIASAILLWQLDGQEEILVGACLARGNALEDGVRATFDAVNRKLVRVQRTPKSTVVP